LRSSASRRRARSSSVRLLLVFSVPVVVVDDDGAQAVDLRATASKISEGFMIADVPSTADSVAPSPVHRTTPAVSTSDDDDDDDDE
jgi:hypothetical protein